MHRLRRYPCHFDYFDCLHATTPWCTSLSAGITVEEKIDRLIESKRALSDELLAAGCEINLTELRNDELLRLVTHWI